MPKPLCCSHTALKTKARDTFPLSPEQLPRYISTELILRPNGKPVKNHQLMQKACGSTGSTESRQGNELPKYLSCCWHYTDSTISKVKLRQEEIFLNKEAFRKLSLSPLLYPNSFVETILGAGRCESLTGFFNTLNSMC